MIMIKCKTNNSFKPLILMKLKYQIPVLLFFISGIPNTRIVSQNVGIGATNPEYKLDIAGRARLRHVSDANTAGLWFNNFANIPYTFAGMRSDTIWGLYENGFKFNFDMDNARLSIGSVIPQYPLVFSHTLGDKISLYGGGGAPNADHYGLGIQGSLMQLFTPTSTSDIAFGYGRSAAFTERMRIKGNGNVGIGISSPLYRLDVDHSVSELMRLTNNTTLAVDVEVEMYFKTGGAYTGAIKTIGTGAINARLGLFTNANANPASLIERMTISDLGNVGIGLTNPTRPLSFPAVLGKKISLYPGANGDAGFGVFGNELRIHSDNPSADITFGYDTYPSTFTERVRIKGNGFVGIGTNAPGFILDVNGRMRIKHSGSTSGVWFANSTNTDDVAFMGLANNTHIGLYGDNGAGFNLVMNTTTGNVGIGTGTPAHSLDVRGSTDPGTIGNFENSSTSGLSHALRASSDSSPGGVGIFSTGQAKGIWGVSSGNSSGFDQIGVLGQTSESTGNNFGVYGLASNGTINYGVYGGAAFGGQNWAGYFQGNVYSSGTYQSSDRKLKSGIIPLSNAMAIINHLNPTLYIYKTREYAQMQLPEGIQYGLIADEVKQILPGLVKEVKSPAQFENHDEVNGRKISDEVEFEAINYTQMIPILIGAMQEQQKQIEHQQQQIAELKKLVNELVANREPSSVSVEP